MEFYAELLGIPAEVVVFIAFLLFTALSYLGLRVIVKGFRIVAEKTENTFDDMVVDEFRKRVKNISVLLGAYFALYVAYGNVVVFGKDLYTWLLVGFLIIFASFFAKITGFFIDAYMSHLARREGKVSKEIFPLARRVAILSIYLIVLIVILGQLGIEITPLVAGLGIGGLAVGLALQDTLANFFSGLHIIAEKAINVGDYVRLESRNTEGRDIEGTVKEINWRATRILSPFNFLVVVPNKEVANSIIVNYSKPREMVAYPTVFWVKYGTDIKKLRKVVKSIKSKLVKKGLILDVKLDNDFRVKIEEYGIRCMLLLPIPNYPNRHKTLLEFTDLLFKELKKNRIDVAYPTSVVMLKR